MCANQEHVLEHVLFMLVRSGLTLVCFCVHCIPNDEITSTLSLCNSGMLLLGGTGKAIRPSHDNPGIAAVVRTTLVRLVTPLKVLNISDKELKLLKEIVLFNPGMYD